MANLIIVSNRLPISVKRVEGKLEFEQGMGGLATGLSGYTQRRGTKWIGWPGIPSDDLTKTEQSQITRELRKHRCYPVFLTKKQIDDYYNGYSNGLLWPLLHNLTIKIDSTKLWTAYRQVNAVFAEETLRLSKPGSMIWVHDYQLMLVPQILRRAGRDDRIGYFLHIPFPEPKAFKKAKEARSLLRGMLGADLVGFHTRGYTRQFLNTCDELLGLNSQSGQLLIGERLVRATEFPMGIDYSRFAEATKQRGKRRELRALRKKYGRRKIIVTVDRLDPSKGLVERLRAYQELLRQQPKLRNKIVMAMVVAPSRTDIAEYKNLKVRLDKILREIQDEFTTSRWEPVDFMYEAIPIERVMSYYQVADVAFIAPIRDGMNLVAKEFIASKRDNNGVLVLSETAGAAEELHGAIQVNPRKLQTMVDGLSLALAMPKRELRERAYAMQRHVQEFTVQKWADSFMGVLQQSQAITTQRTQTIHHLIRNEIVANYAQTKRRLFLLDYDGVLRKFVRTPSEAVPSDDLLTLLRKISDDPKNEVVIISGRSKAELVEWFGDLRVALAAEHGALFRRLGGKNWHKTAPDSRTWKMDALHVFEYYASLTPGARVEQKEWSIAWHYRAASPYYSSKHLVALRRLLRPLLKQYNLTLEEGHKVLELRPTAINKGRIAQEWLIHDHDFILAAGDDVTDEAMFAALPLSSYSIKVGRGRTQANYRIKNVDSMLRLLDRL